MLHIYDSMTHLKPIAIQNPYKPGTLPVPTISAPEAPALRFIQCFGRWEFPCGKPWDHYCFCNPRSDEQLVTGYVS